MAQDVGASESPMPRAQCARPNAVACTGIGHRCIEHRASADDSIRPTLDALSIHRDRRTDRCRQVVACRAARRAARATAVLEETDNPVPRRLLRRPRRRRAAGAAVLPAQSPSPAGRHCSRANLFSQTTVCDYLFDKDKIFAYLNLDDNELFIYQRLYDLLAKDVPAPDLVIYLQAPTDVLLRRLRDRAKDPERDAVRSRSRLPARAERGIPALLLPLLGDAAAGRRNIAARPRRSDEAVDDSDPADPER